MSAGWYHTVGLKSDGTVVATGGNGNGQDNVAGWRGITALSAGGSHTVGLKSDGTVVATGDNSNGQCNVAGWRGITALSAGGSHTVGLKSDGTVVATGGNGSGQRNVAGWRGITALSAGAYHTVGLKSDGTVVSTGDNGSDQRNVAGWAGITAVSAGWWHTVGLKSDGTVVSTGGNGNGQDNVSGWRGITAVSAGGNYTVGLKSDGTVVSTGDNGSGQRYVAGWRGITALSAGGIHTVGLKSDGTVVSTGGNGSGQRNVAGWYLPAAARSVAGATVSGVSRSYVYTGRPITPAPRVTLAGRSLSPVADYTVSYSNNTRVGTARVRISGRGNYTGTIAPTFAIAPIVITSSSVSIGPPSYVYTGLPIRPLPRVTVAGRTLSPTTDYTVSYSNNIRVGTGSVTVVGKGGCIGTVVRTFGIGLRLNRTSVTLHRQDRATLSVRGAPGTIVWSSSNPRVATVSRAGVVTGVRGGHAVVTAKSGRFKALCYVTVLNPRLNDTRRSVRVGSKTTVKVVGGSGGIKWASSKKSVATVSKKGVVTGVTGGTAYITAMRNGVKMTAKVTVTKRDYRVSMSRRVGGRPWVRLRDGQVVERAQTQEPCSQGVSGQDYVGRAKTDSNGKARIRVSRNRYKKTYQAVVSADGRHFSASREKPFVFTYQVYWDCDRLMVDDSTYLKAGTYRVDFTEDSSGDIHWVYESATASRSDGGGDFKLTHGGYVRFWGLSDWGSDEPWIEIHVVRYM